MTTADPRDEPTSGLDSQTAGAVIAAVKATTRDAELTVVCTIHQPPEVGRSVVSHYLARAFSWRRAAADETTRNNSKRNDAKRSKNNTQLVSPRPFVRSRRARLAIVALPPCPAIVTPPFHVSSFLSCWRVAASLCVRSGLRSARARTGTRGLPA